MKRHFKAIAGFIFLVSAWMIQSGEIASSSAIQAELKPKVQAQSPTENQDIAVYITRTGSKYHSAGCRYLARSSTKVALKEALAKGLSPCSVCKPPKATSQVPSTKKAVSSVSPAPKTVSPAASGEVTVYVTRTGAKYHRAGCRYLARSSIPMPLKEAAAKYGPCSVCKPPVQ
jgi:hypothetical protein